MEDDFLYRTVDPDDPSRTQLVRVSAERARELADAGFGDQLQPIGDEEAFNREGAVQAREGVIADLSLGERALGALGQAGLNFADQLTFGASSTFLTDDERLTREAADRDTGLSLAGTAGTVAGVVAPALGVGAAGLGEAGALALTPGGLSQAAGNTASRFLRGALGGRGLSSAAAQRLGTIGGLGIEGGIGGALDTITQANVDGTPLEAEQMLSNGLFGAALGLGVGGLGEMVSGARGALTRRATRQYEVLQQHGMTPDSVRLGPNGTVDLSATHLSSDSFFGDFTTNRFARALSPVGQDANVAATRRVAANADLAFDENFVAREAGNVARDLDSVLTRASSEADNIRSAAWRRQNLLADAGNASDAAVDGAASQARNAAAALRFQIQQSGSTVPAAVARRAERFADLLSRGDQLSGRVAAQNLDDALDVFRTQNLMEGIEEGSDLGRAMRSAHLTGESALGLLDGGRTAAALQNVRNYDDAIRNLRSRGFLREDVRAGSVNFNDQALFNEVAEHGFGARAGANVEHIERLLGDIRAVREAVGGVADDADLQAVADRFGNFRARGELRGDLQQVENAERKASGLPAALGISGAAVGGALGGPVGGAVGAAAGGAAALLFSSLTHPISALRRVQAVREALGGAGERLAAGGNRMRSALRRTPRPDTSNRSGASRIGAARQLPRITTALRSREQRREEYIALRDQLRELANDPEALEDVLAATTGPLAQQGNDMLAMHHAQTLYAGVQYLASNLPAGDTPTPWSSLSEELISQSEMDDFVTRFEAIEDPLSLLDRAADLTLQPEHVEAVRTVYPRLYAEIQAEMAEVLGEIDDIPSFPMRMQIGTLLDLPADPSLEPEFVFALQQTYAQTPQQDAAQTAPRASAKLQRSVSDNTHSESQSMEIRL